MCNKAAGFKTEQAAQDGLMRVQRLRQSTHTRIRAAESRYYWCEMHNLYHLTSKSRNRKSTRRRRPQLIFKINKENGKYWAVNNVRVGSTKIFPSYFEATKYVQSTLNDALTGVS